MNLSITGSKADGKAKRNCYADCEDRCMSSIFLEVYQDTNRWKKRGYSPLKMYREIVKQVADLTMERHYSGKVNSGFPQFEPRKYDSIRGHIKDKIIPHEKKIDPAYHDLLIGMRKDCVTKSGKSDYDALAVAFYMRNGIFYTATSIRNFLEIKSKSKTQEGSISLVDEYSTLFSYVDFSNDEYGIFNEFSEFNA